MFKDEKNNLAHLTLSYHWKDMLNLSVFYLL